MLLHFVIAEQPLPLLPMNRRLFTRQLASATLLPFSVNALSVSAGGVRGQGVRWSERLATPVL